MARAVIITGTKRGIGKDLKLLYLQTHFVISINRATEVSCGVIFSEATPNEITFNLNIEDPNTWEKIKQFCASKSIEIDLVLFNAGVNIADNEIGYTAIESFTKNLNTNFYSVLTAINTLGISFSPKFIYISSMSVIFSNINNSSYSLSKNSSEKLFFLLNRTHSGDKFQIIRLGPVKTDFTKNLMLNSSILKKILFNLIALQSSNCATHIHKYS